MNSKWIQQNRPGHNRRAFTFSAIVITFAILGLLVLAGYGALTSGLGTTRAAQEDLRATKVLLEKMETIRRCDWDQLNPNFIASTFVVPFNVNPVTSNEAVRYYGRVAIEPTNTGPTHTGDTRRVTVRVDWMTGYIPKSRELTINISRNGPQDLVGR